MTGISSTAGPIQAASYLPTIHKLAPLLGQAKPAPPAKPKQAKVQLFNSYPWDDDAIKLCRRINAPMQHPRITESLIPSSVLTLTSHVPTRASCAWQFILPLLWPFTASSMLMTLLRMQLMLAIIVIMIDLLLHHAHHLLVFFMCSFLMLIHSQQTSAAGCTYSPQSANPGTTVSGR